MKFFFDFLNLILYQPLFNILILLYRYLPGQDFGVAVISLTILIRILFYPFGMMSIKSQKILQDLQPKIRAIQKKYKDDKQKQSLEIMKLYQEEKINPFSGCLPLLVQFPILLALYQILRKGLTPAEMTNLYSFVPSPSQINSSFLGIVDLSHPSIILAALAGFFQFLQTKMISPKTPKVKTENKLDQLSKIFQKQTLYFFPFLTFLILFKLPSAIGLYWLVSTLFSIFQQYLVFKKKT